MHDSMHGWNVGVVKAAMTPSVVGLEVAVETEKAHA